jgi:ribose-phosphate pyrophosphokinase
MNVIGDVKNKNVLLIDDLIDTGGTLTGAANVLKEKGAKEIYSACTHPVLSGSALEKIENCALSAMVVTDTIPLRRESHKIKVLTASKLFGEAIRRIHNEESISILFDSAVEKKG